MYCIGQRTTQYLGIASGREQDMALTDGMGAIPERWGEHLGTTDVAIITARGMLLRLARELQGGKEPYAPHHSLPGPAPRRGLGPGGLRETVPGARAAGAGDGVRPRLADLEGGAIAPPFLSMPTTG